MPPVLGPLPGTEKRSRDNKRNETWTQFWGQPSICRCGARRRKNNQHLSSPCCVCGTTPSKPLPPCHPEGRFHFIDEAVEALLEGDIAVKWGSSDLSPGLPWLGHQARMTLEINKTSKRNNPCPPDMSWEQASRWTCRCMGGLRK